MPLFSIITPTLGESCFLEEALESIRTQLAHGFHAEHLLVTSPTGPPVATVVDPQLESRVIEAEAQGAAAAFNVGMRQAKGDLIACLSDDDLYQPEALAEVARAFEANPQIDLVYGGLLQIDEDSHVYRRTIPRPITFDRVTQKNDSYQPALFFRRTLLDRIGLLDESLEYHFWYDFVLRCFLNDCAFHRIKTPLASKRRHRGNRQFGDTSIEVKSAQSLERAEILVRRNCELPSAVALDTGHYRALQQGADPLYAGYDAEVLNQAYQTTQELASREGNSETGGRLLKLKLHARHAQIQGALALKYPRYLIRFLPKTMGHSLRGFFRSRLFQLKQHDPKTPRLKPPKVVSSDSDQLSIGVVTPNYNTAEFIERTIQSVLDQDYPALQYAVQDGGSNDGSVEIIQRYEDQLKYWNSRPDNGQTHAINRGASHLDTDVMAYLNSDDVLLPGCLTYVSEYFRSHPDVDVIYGHRLIIDGDDQEIGRWILPKHDDRAIMFADYIPQETMFWRRSAWEAVGSSLDESFQFAMDWDLILRFRAAGMRFVRVPPFSRCFSCDRNPENAGAVGNLGCDRNESFASAGARAHPLRTRNATRDSTLSATPVGPASQAHSFRILNKLGRFEPRDETILSNCQRPVSLSGRPVLLDLLFSGSRTAMGRKYRCCLSTVGGLPAWEIRATVDRPRHY